MGLDLVALTGAELSRINACVATLLRSVCCCGQDLKGVLCADQWPSSTSRWIDDNNRDVDLLHRRGCGPVTGDGTAHGVDMAYGYAQGSCAVWYVLSCNTAALLHTV
jgi:hypothetical protein